MSFTEKNIYELLPSVYRIRDAEQGEPLKALFEIIAREAKVSEDNIAQLYENWFIETCEEWVVPYIGDLLSVRGLHNISGSSAISQRAYVANTLSYRRRKGIAPVLEQLALDTAGWRAHVTEFFELLAATQYMNHIRLHRIGAPDLRKMNQLDLLNTAFDTIAHSIDVRHISSGHGKYNIPNIGLYIWRIQSYPVIRSDAFKSACPILSPPSPSDYFTFSPLGKEMQLFNRPATETSITHISEEINVPALLRRRVLHDELEARRQAKVDGVTPVFLYFDDRPIIEDDPSIRKHPVFEIYPDGSNTPVRPEEILISSIETCCTPPLIKTYKKLLNNGTYINVDMPITVAVDPVRGKFIFSNPGFAQSAVVSYSYGFSGDTGSGTYNRQDSFIQFKKHVDLEQNQITWHVGVSKTILPVGSETIYKKIDDAITAWNMLPQGIAGIITIMDNHSYHENLDIKIKEKSQLLIIAANWPIREDPDTFPAIQRRSIGDLAAGNLRPHLSGDIKVIGDILDTEVKTGGGLSLNGLLFEGKLTVSKGNLGEFQIAHCAFFPVKGKLVVGTASGNDTFNQWLNIKLTRSIIGPIDLNDTNIVSMNIEDCIIDNGIKTAIDAIKAPTIINNTTVFGDTLVKTLHASNSIFTGNVNAIRRQTGCVRFCFLSGNKLHTPRRYRCQPELEIQTRIAEEDKSGTISDAQKKKIKNEVAEWLVPGFTSVNEDISTDHYGYAQLNQNCPIQIKNGAEDGSEMGAFSYLKQPQRAANLRIALDEYLPLGLEAGVLYVT